MDWLKLLNPQRRPGAMGEASHVRTTFEQDYDRIVFSQPFRRLQDKTQVFPLPENDFVHNRLTHSLEVSSVGRSLGKKAGETIIARHSQLANLGVSPYDFGVITSSASLAHDLGNPPFGHSGEHAISQYFVSRESDLMPLVDEKEWADLINFEGNAQGFRLLSSPSLKLSYAVKGAFSKYPRESLISNPQAERRSQKKYGFFQTEKESFLEIAESLGMGRIGLTSDYCWQRHPLAFLVEAADDICYHIIDLEDGCTLGLVSEEETSDLLSEIVKDSFIPDKWRKIKTRQERIGTLRAMAINQLISESTEIFLAQETAILNGKYDQSLLDEAASKPILDSILSLSVEKLYQSRVVTQIEAAGYGVMEGLLAAFVSAMLHQLHGSSGKQDKTLVRLVPEIHRSSISASSSAYDVIRAAVDFVSGMTDSGAISTYRKLRGITIPRM